MRPGRVSSSGGPSSSEATAGTLPGHVVSGAERSARPAVTFHFSIDAVLHCRFGVSQLGEVVRAARAIAFPVRAAPSTRGSGSDGPSSTSCNASAISCRCSPHCQRTAGCPTSSRSHRRCLWRASGRTGGDPGEAPRARSRRDRARARGADVDARTQRVLRSVDARSRLADALAAMGTPARTVLADRARAARARHRLPCAPPRRGWPRPPVRGSRARGHTARARTVSGSATATVDLDERGLMLSPSAFVAPRAGTMLDPPVLVYPASRDGRARRRQSNRGRTGRIPADRRDAS